MSILNQFIMKIMQFLINLENIFFYTKYECFEGDNEIFNYK